MSDLSVSHAAAGQVHEFGEDVGSFQPVGGAEGLTTEGASAVQAEKPLYTPGVGLSVVEADSFVSPANLQATVEHAVRVRAEGWQPFSMVGIGSVHGRWHGKSRAGHILKGTTLVLNPGPLGNPHGT